MTKEEWEKLKRAGAADRKDFTDFSMKDETLKNFQFKDCIFRNTDFDNTDFTAVTFQGNDTVFESNHARKSSWSRVVFQVRKIENCDFTDSRWSKCIFQGVSGNKFESVKNNYSGNMLDTVAFQEVNSCEENYSNTVLKKCVFQICNYSAVTFFRSYLKGCAWTDVVIQNGNFEEADLTGTNLNDCRCSGKDTSFRRAKLCGTVWDKPNAADMDFCDADLTRAVWRGGDFRKSNFTGAVLDEGDFSDSGNFQGATMANTSMYRTDFTGAQMGAVKESGVHAIDLSGAYMEEANFSDANLYNANMTGCAWYTLKTGEERPVMAQKSNLSQSNLSGAFLLGIDFAQTTLAGADFSNSVLCNASFKGAEFGVSVEGRRVSLSKAWLQGSDFLECKMNATVYSNASVMLMDGPYFQLPADGAEKLDQEMIPEDYAAIFQQNHRSVDPGASVTVLRNGKLWQMNNPNGTVNKVYILHLEENAIAVRGAALGVPLFGMKECDTDSLDRTVIPETVKKYFLEEGYPLPENAVVSVKEAGRFWKVSHLSNDTGSCYVEYNLIKEQEETVSYGYTPMLTFPKRNKEEERDIFICNYTRLFQEDFDSESICPNGEHFSEYKENRTFEELMRAKNPAIY